MKTMFNHNQADLFGARELWQCSAPAVQVGTESDEISRLARKVADLTVKLENCTRLNADQAREMSRLVDMANSEKRKAQQYARDALDAERKYSDQLGETLRLQREIRRITGERASCGALAKETWRLFMQLVHPDKHGGSPASIAAAKWLNEHKPA